MNNQIKTRPWYKRWIYWAVIISILFLYFYKPEIFKSNNQQQPTVATAPIQRFNFCTKWFERNATLCNYNGYWTEECPEHVSVINIVLHQCISNIM